MNASPTGQQSTPFGLDPLGIAIFTADGHFAFINIRADLPKIASNNRLQPTPEENKSIVQGSFALYGTYKLEEKELLLKVDGSTFPNWTGTEQKRAIVSWSPDEFKWELASSVGGNSQVTWRKMK